ncbi:hypothetical protein GW17_00024827 [Ensete ventricosum]|nr:hypothetical protein GW17_00024827 [Ensete ventricosum]
MLPIRKPSPLSSPRHGSRLGDQRSPKLFRRKQSVYRNLVTVQGQQYYMKNSLHSPVPKRKLYLRGDSLITYRLLTSCLIGWVYEVQCGCPAFPYKVDMLVLSNLSFRLYI